jgi:hypothetical protein
MNVCDGDGPGSRASAQAPLPGRASSETFGEHSSRGPGGASHEEPGRRVHAGRAVSRSRYAGRAQQVAFEDRDHYLVVLTAETAPDAFPVEQWIVRCDVRGSCERAINGLLIDEYATLGFVRSRP